MKKCIPLFLPVAFIVLLQACGGDGSNGADPIASAAAVPTGADLGAISARFVPSAKNRSMLFSAFRQIISPGAPEQADSGAMVRLGHTALSGIRQTVDIAGDTHFALGRWVRGTVTYSSEGGKLEDDTDTLTGEDHRSYHYLVYNALAELPASGKFQCAVMAATAPTSDAPTGPKVGSGSGSASVSFDTSGAAIQGTMQVRAGGQSAEVDLSTHIDNAPSMLITGQFFANGAGAAVMLADQGSAAPGLAVGYRIRLPDGALYLGVARFACTRI